GSMADGKWIPDLTPATPVVDAARRALALRLESVREGVGHVLRAPARDPEPIHQLRVGTRRAGAALTIFRQCLPDKPSRSGREAAARPRPGRGRRAGLGRLAALPRPQRAPARTPPPRVGPPGRLRGGPARARAGATGTLPAHVPLRLRPPARGDRGGGAEAP